MEYKIIKSNRKSISLIIDDNLMPVVRAPFFESNATIDAFVNKNIKWIESATNHKRVQLEKYNLSDIEVKELINSAKEYIPERVEYYSELMSLKPTGVKITTAKKRFGSCSGKNSLCFSCFLMLYPEEAIDYIVVHELAHIRHHNHSRQFYALVNKYMPDYRSREVLLKK